MLRSREEKKKNITTYLSREVGARGRLHEERGELRGASGVALDGGGAEPQRAARVAEPGRLVHVFVQPGRAPREVERRDQARQARVRGVKQRQRGPEQSPRGSSARPAARGERRRRGSGREDGEGGVESMTRGPHMSLRWTKPLYVGQNSLTCAHVLKVNGFDSWGTSIRRFCS